MRASSVTVPSMERYLVNEIFYSLQGEGVRAGTPNLFLRLSKCNLTCLKETHGFDCDFRNDFVVREHRDLRQARLDHAPHRGIFDLIARLNSLAEAWPRTPATSPRRSSGAARPVRTVNW